MARKKKHEEHENLERWLVSYADFITLLFAFFTVMYALSQTDKLRYQEAIMSIQRAFLSGGGVFPLKGFPMTPFDKPPDKGSQVPPRSTEVGKYSKTNTNALKRKLQSLYQQTTGMVGGADIDVVAVPEGYKIRFSEGILFSVGASKIKRDNIAFLYEVGNRLKEQGFPIQVEGHTDDSVNNEMSNWQLSLDRATNVVRFLVEATEFPKDKVSLAGYGATQPLAKGTTPQAQAQNRRVEIVILTNKQSATQY